MTTMSSRSAHVFTGPTISEGEVRRILPWACVHPPIRHGDLGEHCERGDVVGIIDGLFYQAPAIRHKEIISALRRGVRIAGASSMGALRASELRSFGMSGVGTVFRLLTTNVIDADDEVAVLHTDADSGWKQLTVAMVSVRIAAIRATTEGRITREEAATAVRVIRKLPFSRRSLGGISRALLACGLSQRVFDALKASLGDKDVKRLDALALLDAMRSERFNLPPTLPGTCGPFCTKECGSAETHFQAVWRWSGQHERDSDRQRIMAASQLFLPGYRIHYAHAVLDLMADSIVRRSSGTTDTKVEITELAEKSIAAAAVRGILPPTWSHNEDSPASLQPFLRTAERETWRREDERLRLATVALIRSCRVPPGVPPAHIAYERMSAQEIDLAAQYVQVASAYNEVQRVSDPRKLPHRVKRTAALNLLARLWGEPLDGLCALERGFASLEQAIKAAQLFVPASMAEQLPRAPEAKYELAFARGIYSA